LAAAASGSTPEATDQHTARPADSAPIEGGTSAEKGTAGRAGLGSTDLSFAYDEPRSNFHAACPFDCPWGREDVPRGDFFRGAR
jgi:hypothetical protein